MAVNAIITDQAERDLMEVHVWYELRGVGLGEEFLERFEQCLDIIRQRPLAGRLIYKEYRRALLKQFPYAVFYRCEDNVVYVQSVLHSARDPKKWRELLP